MTATKLLPVITSLVVIFSILFLSGLVLEPFLYVFIVSTMFSIFLHPIYTWLLKKLKVASISALVTIILLLIFILTPVFFVITSIFLEARDLLIFLQTNPSIITSYQQQLTSHLQLLGSVVSVEQINLQEQATGFLRNVVQNLGSTLLYAGAIVLNTFFMLMTIYFLLVQKNEILQYIASIQIIPQKHFELLKKRTVEMVNGVLRGNLFVIASQMVVGSIGFLMFSIGAPLLLGVMYGLFSLLPAVGASIISIPIAVYLFINEGIITALLFIAWFTLTNLALDNYLAPKIIGGQTKIHQLFILFSVIGGVQQFGLIGVVLGPVIVALAFVAIDIYKDLNQFSDTNIKTIKSRSKK